MTLDELDRLPTVNRIFGGPEFEWVAANGSIWAAGLSGNTWVKCWVSNNDPPPGAARRA